LINKLGKGGDTRFSQDDLELLSALAASVAVALENAGLYKTTKGEMSEAFRTTLASMSQYAYDPLKAFATNTYALKAGLERGTISCADDTMNQLLSSMERHIQQMASLTEIFNLFASPETSAKDWGNLERRFEKLKAQHAS